MITAVPPVDHLGPLLIQPGHRIRRAVHGFQNAVHLVDV